MSPEEITSDIDWLISNKIINQSLVVNTNWKWIAKKDLEVSNRINAILSKYQVSFIAEITAIFRTENKVRPVCESCGNLTSLNKVSFNRFCSKKCAAVSEQTQLTRDKTNIDLFGTRIPQQTKALKDKAEKTLKERYGDNPPHLFGGDSYNQLMIEKYSDHPMRCQEIKDKLFDVQSRNFNLRLRLQNEALGFFTDQIINSREYFKFTCKKCNNEFEARTWLNKPPRCFVCQPLSISPQHLQVGEFLSKSGIKFEENNRIAIRPKELDFYIPDYKLAIEINGLYWHSEAAGTSKMYHQEKSLACLKQGISLVHLFEDELELDFDNTMSSVLENYFALPLKSYSGMVEVNGAQPLSQFINAKFIKAIDPEPYKVNSEFKKIKSLKTTIWDCGKFVYSL